MRIHLSDGQRNKYGNYSGPHFRKLENSHGFVFSSQCKRELNYQTCALLNDKQEEILRLNPFIVPITFL